MKSGILTLLSFLSALFLPWVCTVLIACAGALVEPLLPLAAGLFTDVLYYAPGTYSLPLATLGGAAVTGIAFFVRTRVRPGPVR